MRINSKLIENNYIPHPRFLIRLPSSLFFSAITDRLSGEPTVIKILKGNRATCLYLDIETGMNQASKLVGLIWITSVLNLDWQAVPNSNPRDMDRFRLNILGNSETTSVFLLPDRNCSDVFRLVCAGCAVAAYVLILHCSRNFSKYETLLVTYFETVMVQALQYYYLLFIAGN